MDTFIPWFTAEAESPLGYVDRPALEVLERSALLRQSPRGFELDSSAPLDNRLDDMRLALRDAGCIGPERGERMPVFFDPAEAPIASIDRSAMRILGIWAIKVHLNGLVFAGDRFPEIWLSRRSRKASSDPGKLDTMVAGGQPAGLSTAQTLAKESREEVGLPPSLVALAEPKGRLRITYPSPQGLHRELLAMFDLNLPDDFVPKNRDGEIAECVRLTWNGFAEALAYEQSFKHSSYLVSRHVLQRYCSALAQ